MKVAYNNCFGGFGVSEEGLRFIAKKKGVDLSGAEFRHGQFFRDGKRLLPDYSFGEDDRTDLDLIECIETLGERADGFCASLAIEEIPDGAQWELTEYDGNESVVPPRQSW